VKIRSSNLLISHVRALAQSPPTSVSSSVGSRSHRTLSQSYDGTDQGEGAGEIAALAKRILDFADGDGNVFQTQQHARADGGGNDDSGEEDQLRKSVREALGVAGSHDGQQY
jgi:vacuolar protein 8